MRQFLHYGLPCFCVLFGLSLLFMQGCARQVLQTYPASEQESEAVLKAFSTFLATSEEECGCCLDAEADAALLVPGWFKDHTVKLSGYLQVMKPGYIKFIALNPLGQPQFIFVADGETFKSLNVFQGKAYFGSVRSEAYRKFAPLGFNPHFSYYWLTGRLQPEALQIQAVQRDREQERYWLRINHDDASTDSMVLFDPREQVILRHVLRDKSGKHLVDIRYADYQPLPGKERGYPGSVPATSSQGDTVLEKCRVPARITFYSTGEGRKIELDLHSFLNNTGLSVRDFHIVTPDNFKELLVK